MSIGLNLGLNLGIGARGAGGPSFNPALYPLSTAVYNGDSRTASSGGRVNNGSSCATSIGLSGVASLGIMQATAGNIFILPEGFQRGIGASTSLAQEERAKSTSIANTGNPANAVTAITADALFATASDGVISDLTQAGNHVFTASIGVNDPTATAFYDAPHVAWQTLRVISRVADDIGAANKVWYVGNEYPRGDTYYTMESRTVTGGTCTAINTVNFVDGEQFGALGAIGVFSGNIVRPLVKVASSPGQDEYTVTSGGVYTFGGTAPLNAFLNYSATPPAGRLNTPTQIRVINEFCNSSASNFVSSVNGVDYEIPGLRFNRPWVRVVDTFGALVDPATGSDQRIKLGTGDVLRALHLQGYGQYLSAKAFAQALAQDYPTAPDLSTGPTRNNWYAARGTGAGTTFTGTLPPSMRTGFTGTAAPTLITINGAVVGAVNTSTGAISGPNITAGSLDFSTGAWSITLNSAALMPVNAQLWFEQDIGNGALEFSGGVFASWTEGTIGRNPVMNGLMDMTAAVGSNLTTTTGTSTMTSVVGSQVPYGYLLQSAALQTAINNGTATVNVINNGNDADGFPIWQIEIQGIHTAAIEISLNSGALNNFTQRVTAGDRILGGMMIRYARHSTVGKLFGNNGATATTFISTAAVSRTSPTGPQNVTALTTRNTDQGTNLYQVDELIMNDEGGVFDQYRVSPLLDTTGATFASNQFSLVLGRANANVPFAFRMGAGRIMIRRRGDVV